MSLFSLPSYRSTTAVFVLSKQAAGGLALGLLITIPLQALLPSLTLYLANQPTTNWQVVAGEESGSY